MNLRLFKILLTAALNLTNALITSAADLSFAAGAFRFNATDYYYPNFYLDAGYRGGPEAAVYYYDVFLPKEKKLRPFGEAGFAYSF